MNDVAAPTARIRAFAWDYLVVLGYLVGLTAVGLALTFGPAGAAWTRSMEDPVLADLVAFVLTVLPVVLYFTLSEGSGAGATWGKRRVGLVVVVAGLGTCPGLGRAFVRNGLKFLPWQMAHTAMFHVPGFPAVTGEPPTWTVVVLGTAWFFVLLYLVGLTKLGGHRPMYDRMAGTVVVLQERAAV